MMDEQDQVRQVVLKLLRPLVSDRTVFLAGSVAQSQSMHEFMSDCGARTVPVPLESKDHCIRGRFLTYERLLEQPQKDLQETVRENDIDGAGLFYAGSFSSVGEVCGRQVIGARRPGHLEAERKDLQREILDLDGIVVSLADRFPDILVPTVVQGVPKHGVAMAASHTYLVPQLPNKVRLDTIIDGLRHDCSRAILSSFSSGIPCTYYGFVTETAVVDFGPVEALVYWDPTSWRVRASGIIRPLDITEPLLTTCRSSVHTLARALRKKFGYLGAFGVDGVISDQGYTIHEINPRVCAGFALLNQLVYRASPLAAIDLVLREVSGASFALSELLSQLSVSVAKDTTARYRFWELPNMLPQGPKEEHALALWKEDVRRCASGGLPPITQLKGSFS